MSKRNILFKAQRRAFVGIIGASSSTPAAVILSVLDIIVQLLSIDEYVRKLVLISFYKVGIVERTNVISSVEFRDHIAAKIHYYDTPFTEMTRHN